jgi:interferon gamma-inducible protein 30
MIASIVLGGLAVAAARTLTKRATVRVFYEAQCPYSLKFLNTTLREAWSDVDLWKHLDVHFYPFGNARVVPEKSASRGYHFWHSHATYPIVACQHGETECLGNRIHSCAMDLLQEEKTYVPFIMCMASFGTHSGVELTSYECGTQLGINMDQLKECTNSEKGRALELSAGRATQSHNVSYVPFIFVNGHHTKNDTLLEPICDLLQDDKPTICLNSSTSRHGHKKKGCGGSGGFLSKHIESKSRNKPGA